MFMVEMMDHIPRVPSTSWWTNELHVFDLNKGMGECILLSILQHTLHGIERLHASFCHRTGGHFGAQLPVSLPILPYFYENSTAKRELLFKLPQLHGVTHTFLSGYFASASTQGAHWIPT